MFHCLMMQKVSIVFALKIARPEAPMAPWFNPLSPNSDQHLISPHNITDSSNIHVTRMNEMITKDGMS